MMQHRLTAWMVVVFIFAFVACSSTSTSSQVDATDATAVDAAQTGVGTNVGNPNTPVKAAVTNSLALQTSVTSSESTDDTTTEGTGDSHGGVTASSADCTPIAFDMTNHIAASQKCTLTPADYELGILAISLVQCVDESATTITCDPKIISAITSRSTLYSGDQVNIAITSDGVGFPQKLEVLADSASLSAGGLQIVTAYVGEKFPDDASNPSEAAKVASYLKGKTFHICTTPESVGEELMLTRCGNAKAKLGDLLVDLDGDGVFGFVNTDTIANNFAEETTTRPENYNGFIDFFMTNFDGGAVSFYTTTEDYTTTGYFEQLWPFASVVTADSATSNIFNVTVGISDTSFFTDGRANRSGSGGDTCVSALYESGCLFGDDDPSSVGIYDPYYDVGLTVTAPLPSVTVEQTSASKEE